MEQSKKAQKKQQNDTKALIAEAVAAGLQAGRLQAASLAKDVYKATERRLYALPVLEKKVLDDKEKLAEIQEHGPQGRSQSIVRFQRSGYRADPDEMLEAIIRDMLATIAADEHEIGVIRSALSKIENDVYYPAISGKYFNSQSDDMLAELISCDSTTIWRHRKRLVQKLSLLLYGSMAL